MTSAYVCIVCMLDQLPSLGTLGWEATISIKKVVLLSSASITSWLGSCHTMIYLAFLQEMQAQCL